MNLFKRKANLTQTAGGQLIGNLENSIARWENIYISFFLTSLNASAAYVAAISTLTEDDTCDRNWAFIVPACLNIVASWLRAAQDIRAAYLAIKFRKQFFEQKTVAKAIVECLYRIYFFNFSLNEIVSPIFFNALAIFVISNGHEGCLAAKALSILAPAAVELNSTLLSTMVKQTLQSARNCNI